MAPRLQGRLHPDGALEAALWGAGALGRVRFTPLAGPFTYAPNNVVGPSGGFWVAQSRPAVLLRGVRLLGVTPARRPAPWAEASTVRSAGAAVLDLPWARLLIEPRYDGTVLAAGADADEARAALALPTAAIVAEAEAQIAACDRLPEADALLRSLVAHGVHAALASVRRDRSGGFAGLAAGLAYSTPARTYFRDSYWTAALLLQTDLAAVRSEIDVLARGVRPDGEAASGVIVGAADEVGAWERARAGDPELAQAHLRPGDWWSDHFDSPLYFVLLTADYLRASGDAAPAHRHWDLLKAVFRRYWTMAVDNGLPLKPRHDRDWADNVRRAGLVAYDLGLWVGAADAMAEIAAGRDEPLRAAARVAAARARAAIEAQLWRAFGWYADYAALGGFVEDHLTLDSLTLLAFGAAPHERALAVLDSVQANLESRRNDRQPYGDWGVLCAFPPYRRRADLRAKSAFPYRYHNGGDWPWLDGLYARERLRRGLSGWRYPLTRWWEFCLAAGWPGAVEHFSPPYGRGSLLQAWSSFPAAVALAHRKAVLAGDPEV